MFVKFLHCKATLFSLFPYCTLWKEVTMRSLHLGSGEWWSTSSRMEYLHQLLDILLHRKYVSPSHLIYSTIYLYEFGPLDFFFFYTSGYHVTTLFWGWNCSSFGHWELFHWAPVSFWHTLIIVDFFVLFDHFLTFWHYKMSQALCVYFLPQSWNQPFLQGT